MRVLVIDDAMVMRNIHKNILRDFGLKEGELSEAPNGKAALQIATSGHIDLFLVDWNMPELSGIDFVKTIRAMDSYKETPIIMVTSEAAKYNVLEAIEAGVTNYIVKPIQAETLKEKLEKYII
jgi:Response regulator containing CheY-like receiver, AAA-type ATPase, and DNA-binding domains